MKISELIDQLKAIQTGHGDLQILQQADQEGNSYDWSRGVEVGFVTDGLEYCYSSEEDAIADDREDYTTCVVVYP